MTIPNEQAAQYNSLQDFIGFFKDKDNAPSFTNLFSVHFATPPMLAQGTYQDSGKFDPQKGDLRNLLNYYAESVNLPSKQVTTGNYNQLGSAIRYATGSTFSQISITFRVPRSGETRAFFERWIALMSNDASQYTDYYENYVCPFLRIYKWERGGGDLAISKREMLRAVRESRISRSTAMTPKLDQLTGVYELRNVFPYNIGSIQLDNSQNKLMSLTVQFYYERYRFYQDSQFTVSDRRLSVPDQTDTNTDPGTDPAVNATVNATTAPISGPGADPRTIARNRGT